MPFSSYLTGVAPADGTGVESRLVGTIPLGPALLNLLLLLFNRGADTLPPLPKKNHQLIKLLNQLPQIPQSA